MERKGTMYRGESTAHEETHWREHHLWLQEAQSIDHTARAWKSQGWNEARCPRRQKPPVGPSQSKRQPQLQEETVGQAHHLSGAGRNSSVRSSRSSHGNATRPSNTASTDILPLLSRWRKRAPSSMPDRDTKHPSERSSSSERAVMSSMT